MRSSRGRRRTVLVVAAVLAAVGCRLPATESATTFPWREAGLTERQAAAHLLARFTFGARPGDLDAVTDRGLEAWFEAQLAGAEPEVELDSRLVELEPLFLPFEEIALRYPDRGRMLREAQAAGVLPTEMSSDAIEALRTDADARREVMTFAAGRGYRPQKELMGALAAQKVLRAVYAENQLHEMLAEFWFNHFYVSVADNQARPYVLAYERDAVRPFVTADFRRLLGATARHPAMLLYLDNARSTADGDEPTTLDRRLEEQTEARTVARRGGRGWRRTRGRGLPSPAGEPMRRRSRAGRTTGLNENYARELLELHTLGVDGGYDQQDVIEVARAFTGWSVLRPEMMLEVDGRRRVERALALDAGFVLEDGFVFRADAHDAGSKSVLGHRLPAGRGIEDGDQVLDLLAGHPSTAHHLATKLATRFVDDAAPSTLVDRLAAEFLASGGDVAAVMRTLAGSEEFWAAARTPAKVKSPLELAASALRALGARVDRPADLVEWIGRMGQPLYQYQAPTGYPDSAEFWITGGTLLNRMNFGLALAAGGVRGVRLDPGFGLEGGPPADRGEALERYARQLLPGRETAPMLALLEPLVAAPDLVDRFRAATSSEPGGRAPTTSEQAVGVLLGSPEFQRR